MLVPPIRPRLAVTILIDEASVPRHAGHGKSRGRRPATRVQHLEEEAAELETIENGHTLAPPANYAQHNIWVHVYTTIAEAM